MFNYGVVYKLRHDFKKWSQMKTNESVLNDISDIRIFADGYFICTLKFDDNELAKEIAEGLLSTTKFKKVIIYSERINRTALERV